MTVLNQAVDAVERHHRFVAQQVVRARRDARFRRALLERWRRLRADAGTVVTPTGLELPRLALPPTDEPGEVARYLFGEGSPGEFPFANGAYRNMYLPEKLESKNQDPQSEEPTRLFAGLGLPEDTNRRFHYLKQHQRTIRLSTAFDGPTLYGIDSDHAGVLGKVGEGGVAIDTIDDMTRLFAGFPLGDEHFSVSMTINAPAPILLAMYTAAARRKFGRQVVARLRGTVQADMLKEVQAQNEIIFPLEFSLRMLGDMVDYTTHNMPRWYPISISGYHIAEAGATPVQQAAFTLANGLTYVELFRRRGMDVDVFGPRLSFFLDCGLDVEYAVLGRVCRRLWAIWMRDVFGGGARAQLFRLHTQTSGRSLVAPGFQNNLTRTAVELMLAYFNYTNSCHSNSADEPFTTPSEQYVRLAALGQAILLEESGLFKHTVNLFGGAPGLQILEQAVERGVLDILREMDGMGGVLAAIEQRYQRSQIQEAALIYERQINAGERPIIGRNRYAEIESAPQVALERTSRARQQLQVRRVRAFRQRHARAAIAALDRLERVVRNGGNVFEELLTTVESCSLGQITARLHTIVGYYRPAM